ncbi:hypothetical protein P0W64_04370 [Tsukamurella sp. 8F]|uniref:hypothetical protein n=1 Tax=unclassified Tsukamurella TaxID=2633480 RepID=UPI0023BA0191|nr:MULTISPECIES: hypothetical protein [unclassified Tsukamurella]MDF0529723.1 hypothetical protein [Tsukamurella sp. 8J]MDF0586008.1 hypothetical protein [Tsukamurella sp. 8F]
MIAQRNCSIPATAWRISTAEVESALVGNAHVAAAADIGDTSTLVDSAVIDDIRAQQRDSRTS